MIEQLHISTLHWSSIAQLLNDKLFFRRLLSSSVYYSILDFVLYYLDWTINLAAIQFSISVRPSKLFNCFYKYLNIMQFPHFFYFFSLLILISTSTSFYLSRNAIYLFQFEDISRIMTFYVMLIFDIKTLIGGPKSVGIELNYQKTNQMHWKYI